MGSTSKRRQINVIRTVFMFYVRFTKLSARTVQTSRSKQRLRFTFPLQSKCLSLSLIAAVESIKCNSHSLVITGSNCNSLIERQSIILLNFIFFFNAGLALSALIIVHMFQPANSVPFITQPPDEHVDIDRGVLSGVLNDYIRNFREILGEAHRLYVSKAIYLIMILV